MNNDIQIDIHVDSVTNRMTWAISTSDSPHIKQDNELSIVDCKRIKEGFRCAGAWVNNQLGLAYKREEQEHQRIKAEIESMVL